MPYDITQNSRSWATYSMLLIATGVVAWLAIVHSALFYVFLGPQLAWIGWCIACDAKWRIRVYQGTIRWNALFWGTERSIPVSDLSGIEFERDPEGCLWTWLRFASGQRRHFYIPAGTEQQFAAAVVEEIPAIEILRTGQQRAST